MVALNHAIATAMVQGPAAGLARIDELAADPRVAEHHRLDAVRAHLLERAGDLDAAFAHYRRAAERTTSVPERDYLLLKAGRVRDRGAEPSVGAGRPGEDPSRRAFRRHAEIEPPDPLRGIVCRLVRGERTRKR